MLAPHNIYIYPERTSAAERACSPGKHLINLFARKPHPRSVSRYGRPSRANVKRLGVVVSVGQPDVLGDDSNARSDQLAR